MSDKPKERAWEYTRSCSDVPLGGEDLNQHGKLGWELVAVIHVNGGFWHYYFKRPASAG